MYNLKKLSIAVNKYKKILKNIKGKTALITVDILDKNAFYSLAPLSQAIHELGGDLNAQVINKKSANLEVLKDVWTCYGQLTRNIKNKKTKALKDFIDIADKKCKNNLKWIFASPEIFLSSTQKGFQGSFQLPYLTNWMTEVRQKDLLRTSKIIWDQVYNLKKSEKASIGFELLRKQSDLGLPLTDYLDSFQISRAMMLAAKQQVEGMGSSLSRKSTRDNPERISELKATLLGCELCKEVDEPIFKKFKILSKELKINRIKIASAVFFIRGKGYGGRHIFGEYVGYPSINKKTRWMSPGQMIYQFDFFPQTALDPRKPLARVAFTETLPIDIFIQTCNIDWLAMQKLDHKIIALGKKVDHIIVEGKKFGKYQTKLKVGLVKGKMRRYFRPSDVETRELIKKHYLKRTCLFYESSAFSHSLLLHIYPISASGNLSLCQHDSRKGGQDHSLSPGRYESYWQFFH